MSRNGDNISPYYRPLDALKVRLRESFKNVANKGMDIRDLTHLIHWGENPKETKTLSRCF